MMIVKNRLLNYKDMIIYQNDNWFLFSLDSVLLANFTTIKLSDKKILDFCSGNAPIPLLMSYRTKGHITGIEIQKEIFDLGVMSIKENKLEEKIDFVNGDVKDIDKYFLSESVDIVTCNPPYFKYKDSNFINIDPIKTNARHEKLVELEDIIKSAAYVLKNGGTFSMVHRPERFVEIIDLMRKYNIEPKKVRFVYPKINKDANILLIEGNKNGNCGIKFLSPLITHKDNNEYVEEIRDMFGDEKNVAN